MARRSIADAIRYAWKMKRIEVIAGVADGMRLEHGYNYSQVHKTFEAVLGIEIPLAEFDAIMYAADEGDTGVIDTITIRRPADDGEGRTHG
jgi:hypothetical protein